MTSLILRKVTNKLISHGKGANKSGFQFPCHHKRSGKREQSILSIAQSTQCNMEHAKAPIYSTSKCKRIIDFFFHIPVLSILLIFLYSSIESHKVSIKGIQGSYEESIGIKTGE